MNLRILKLTRLFHLITKEDYNKKRQIEIVKNSPLFDAEWYLEQYPDVAQLKNDPAKHYVKYGWKEGRNPSKNFSTNDYLNCNKDVKICPLAHYEMFGKSENRKLRNRKSLKMIITPRNLHNLICNRFRNLHPLNLYMSSKNDEYRLNVVTDTIAQSSLLGGVGTALILASQFCVKYNIELRIITRTTEPNPDEYRKFMKLQRQEIPSKISFYSDENRNEFGLLNNKLVCDKKEIFFATSWWSAKAIIDSGIDKIFYLIQEVETFFYNYGDEHLMCHQTINNTNIKFIVNHRLLWKYFSNTYENIIKNGVYFNPCFPKFLYNNDMGGLIKDKSEKYKMFFYARKNNSRNLYYTGLQILDEALKRNIIDTSKWDIYFCGSDVDEITFSTDYSPIQMGQLNWEDYANFIKNIDLGLCLMYTPHPSYPPLDIAASGGICVTNKFLNKEKIDGISNIILGNIDNIDDFLIKLQEGINLSMNPKKRLENYNNANIPSDWNCELEGVLNFMKENLDEYQY